METEELQKKRFRELAQKSYQNNQYTFTGFLGLADVSGFYELERELSYVPYTIWGGREGAERVMIRFGSEELLGYTQDFPITCLQIRPLAEKFADVLTHRDFLGALMNLGIERSTIGDILIEDKTAYLFCLESMADFVMENLTRVKHTTVLCRITEKVPEVDSGDAVEMKIQVSSNRVDGIVAKVCRLSRSETAVLFTQKKIFINGRLCENSSRMLAGGDVVSMRGYGKFELLEGMSLSKKGKRNLTVLYYGKR